VTKVPLLHVEIYCWTGLEAHFLLLISEKHGVFTYATIAFSER